MGITLTQGIDQYYDDDLGHSIKAQGGQDKIYGFGGNDDLDGGDDFDTLDGGSGADTLHGGRGDDYLVGGSGGELNDHDALYGEQGNDTLEAGYTSSHASYTLDGGSGNNHLTLVGGDHSTLNGGSDVDTIQVSFAGDFDIDAGSAGDLITVGGYSYGVVDAGAGNDQITANAQTSIFTISGGTGDDVITLIGNVSSHTEVLQGDGGNDTIYSNLGNNILDGGQLNDWLYAANGNATLTGGLGKDTFVFDAQDAHTQTITDYKQGQDHIQINGAVFDDVHFLQQGDDAMVSVQNLTIIVEDTLLSHLQARDFIFA